MATPPRNARRPLAPAAQRGALLARLPDSHGVLRAGRLVWRGKLHPAEFCAEYEVLIDHQERESPLVYVAAPRLRLHDDEPLPHVYSWNTLCLYLDRRQWDASLPIADTLVPWTSEWLYFYELWAAGGGWQGEGPHPTPGSTNRATRRDYERVRRSKFKRLASALGLAYGSDGKLDELLYNAQLKPSGHRQAPIEAA